MHSDIAAEARGLLDRGLELCERVLIRRMQHPVAHRIRARLIDLGEVGPLLVLLSNRGNDLIGAVGIGCVRQDLLGGIEVIGILVAAEYIDGVAGDSQPWSWDQTLVDGISHCSVSGSRAF